MIEMIIQGRGGQGAQTAGNLLAQAFFSEGRYVQAFATYGGARRGTPVSSYIRVDDKPIRYRCDIEHPQAILCFDASLLETGLLRGANKDTAVVVNTTRNAGSFENLGQYRIYTIDGFSLSQSCGLGKVINSALLGAFACILGMPDIESMRNTIAENAPVKREENVNACLYAYKYMRENTLT